MSAQEFKKPERVIVDALGYLSDVLKNGIVKDLQENQILCSTCKGTGLAIVDNVYGLKNDPNKSKMFPYSKQYIASCSDCYAGVINLCKHCQCELPRHKLICDCDKAKSIRRNNEIEKEKQLLDKAVKVKYDDPISKDMGMYYFDGYPYNNGYFSDIEEFIEWWEDEYDSEDEKPKYVWGTYSINLRLDANDLIANACDDLHEEALSNISDSDMNELQAYLDSWCDKQTGTTTYYSDMKYAIEIPWE